MADKRECAICRKMIEQKHKSEKIFKTGFFVVLALFIITLILLLSKGDIIKTTINNSNTNANIENNSDVDINGDGNNLNWDNGSYTIS